MRLLGCHLILLCVSNILCFHNFTDNFGQKKTMIKVNSIFFSFLPVVSVVKTWTCALSRSARLLAFCIIIWKVFYRSPSWTFEQGNYSREKFESLWKMYINASSPSSFSVFFCRKTFFFCFLVSRKKGIEERKHIYETKFFLS